MEKPARIVSTEKIRNFNEKVRAGLEQALNFMMALDSGKIQVGPFEPFLMPIEAYISAYKKQSVLIKLYSDKDFQGELYWFFELRTAISLGSLLRMLPIPAMEEKLSKKIFDANDQDSFGEVGNQLCGILDRVFRTVTNKNIHLRMDFNKKVYPDESIRLDSFVNREEYVVFLANLVLPGAPVQKITLLLPRSLYEVMLNIEISLEGITPKLVVVHSHDSALLERLQIEMNSRYTTVLPAASQDDVFKLVDTPGVAAVGVDLREMSSPLSLQDSIYLKRLVTNRTFTRIPYFLTWKNADNATLEEVKKLGLAGATTGSFEQNFARWAVAFTQDPTD